MSRGAMTDGPTGPLQGIRVVDFTQALAGPFATMLLADLGADLVKIEPPAGDMTRFSGPMAPGDTERHYGGYFASINRNKRSVVLDLKSRFGVEAALELCERADAVTENSRAGVMDSLGLGYETLAERNPRLVYAAIRGFGDARTGASPYEDWPAFDVVAQAMGGAVGMTGNADGQIYKVGPSVGDIYPATLMALGVSAALVHAQRSGRGQFLDVAMYDAVLSMCEALVYRYSYGGMVTVPAGNGHPMLCPMDLFPTADGACAVAAPTERHWPLLARLIDRPDLADDPRCRTNRQRVANAAFVREVIGGWMAARTKAEVVATLAGHVPVGPVHTAPDVFTDPHVAARNMLVDVPHPGAQGPMTVVGSAIHLTGTAAGIYRRPPKLGEHTAEVLAEIGRQPSPESEPAPRVRL
jgi:crotonobetainyl-CoA:carnitine CoA-transferase CaiB-like acyl-CoA transferase